jgi:hypothetical protein
MATFDAFSFIQVTIMFFICLGLGCALLRVGLDAVRPEAPRRDIAWRPPSLQDTPAPS